jgi:hypothetical protein
MMISKWFAKFKARKREIEAINAENKKTVAGAGESAERLSALLKKNGVTMQVIVATGGDNHGNK